MAQLAEERENARREKNWKRSDELRERISALGWEVRDTKDGPKLTRGAGSGSHILRSLLFERVIKSLDLRSKPGAHEFAKFVIVIF